MASENWHDHDNVFGYRHEVNLPKATAGGFTFVGMLATAVAYLIVRHRRKHSRNTLATDGHLSDKEFQDKVVGEAVADATAEYAERTGLTPKPTNTYGR